MLYALLPAAVAQTPAQALWPYTAAGGQEGLASSVVSLPSSTGGFCHSFLQSDSAHCLLQAGLPSGCGEPGCPACGCGESGAEHNTPFSAREVEAESG